METNNSFSVTMTDENGNAHSLDGVLSLNFPQVKDSECRSSVHIYGSGTCKMVISDELRGKLMKATGYMADVDTALRELAKAFKTGESMKLFANELKKRTVERDKPKPTKPYWRTGERW